MALEINLNEIDRGQPNWLSGAADQRHAEHRQQLAERIRRESIARARQKIDAKKQARSLDVKS